MIDIYLYGDICDDVRKICKKKWKSGLFDFSKKWKEEYDKVMDMSFSDIQDWIKENKS